MGRIIAIANQKGGVGKTTTAINLSASVAAAEHRCLVVDVDPQGNASSGIGLQAREEKLTLYESLAGQTTLREVIYRTELPCLDAVRSTRDLAAAEVELVDEEDRAWRLATLLEPIREDYDFIFLDCPPSLGLLTLNALCAADGLVVPLQCEYYALEGLAHLLDTVEKVRASLNPGLEIDGIILTMYDGRTNLSQQVASEVRQHFADLVFEAVVPRNVRLSESPSHGKPILLYDIASKGSQSYIALANELVRRQEASDGAA